MHTRLEQQIASKVIDRTPREGGETAQLQSLLSPQEISHGQSELELRRGPLETWEMMLYSIFAKKKFLKEDLTRVNVLNHLPMGRSREAKGVLLDGCGAKWDLRA